MRIRSVGTAFPPHYYDQDALLAAMQRLWAGRQNGSSRLERFHRKVLVGGRHLALPLEEYEKLGSWGQANDAWIRVAQEVGEAAVREALARAELAVEDVDALFFVSVTGVATPSIDAHLINRLGLRTDLKRLPIFGLGCVAGAAGLARAADYVKAYPDGVAVVLAVELCSLTLQREDLSVANLVATGLFGDGAAAAVVVGEERSGPGPRIIGTRSFFYRGSEDVMGWRVSEKGFGVVLSARVPEMVREHLRPDTDTFLAAHGLRRDDMARWICHPGGPRVLEAMEDSLALPAGSLDLAWKSLSRLGNLSSASVLMILEDTMNGHAPPPGGHGLLLAMGPGFCSELVLLRWPE